MSEKRQEADQEALDTLEWERDQLREALWGWLVARPQTTDGDAALDTLGRFLDAREKVKAMEKKLVCQSCNDCGFVCDDGKPMPYWACPDPECKDNRRPCPDCSRTGDPLCPTDECQGTCDPEAHGG